MNDVYLNDYKLIKLKDNNPNDLSYLNQLMNEYEFIKYLGHLEQDRNNVYIISDTKNNYIGYLSMSNIITNSKNLTSITLYYAIDKQYRNLGHGATMLTEVSDYLLDNVDMLVLMIDITNTPSMKTAEKAGFKEEYRDDEDVIYTKYSHIKNKKR